MAIDRISSVLAQDDDADDAIIEVTLRPQSFDDYIGQERLKNNLKLAITAAKKRGEPIDHVLLYGPPGLGKTSMASVIANEMGVGLRVTSGPAIEKAGDLASILTNLADGDILFIDEIHRLGRAVEEVLYSAMEDFKLDIVIGKGPADRHLLVSIIDNYGSNPVGLSTIAALTGDEAGTIEDFYEPYLLQIGFIERTPRGRRVTPRAHKHVGKSPDITP
jgi:Holliday junction DNA helicase RuvB